MKKYLKITGFVALFLAIFVIFTYAGIKLWFNPALVPKKISWSEYNICNTIAFAAILLVYALIYKLRGKNLIKIMDLRIMSFKNWILAGLTGILMGIFTCSICNTGFIKSLKVFDNYVNSIVNGNSTAITFVVVITVTFAMEEMIFRGTIFNEIRSGVQLKVAILLGTLLYGVFNAVFVGYYIGIYASFAALFFTLGYIFLRSLWASITMQILSVYVMYFFVKSRIWEWFGKRGDAFLMISTFVSVVSILIIYYAMYKSYKNSGSSEFSENTISGSIKVGLEDA